MKYSKLSFKLVSRQNLDTNSSFIENFFKNKFSQTQNKFFFDYTRLTSNVKEPHPNSDRFKDYIKFLAYKPRKTSFLKLYLLFLNIFSFRKPFFWLGFNLIFIVVFYVKCLKCSCGDFQSFLIIKNHVNLGYYFDIFLNFFKNIS